MNKDLIIEELSRYSFESNFYDWIINWLDSNSTLLFSLFNEKSEIKLKDMDYIHVSTGLSFQTDQNLVALTLTFKDFASLQASKNCSGNVIHKTLIFSESERDYVDIHVTIGSSAEKILPHHLKNQLSRLNNKHYLPLDDSKYRVICLSDTFGRGYHCVLVENLQFGGYVVMEFLDDEIIASSDPQFKFETALKTFHESRGCAGYSKVA